MPQLIFDLARGCDGVRDLFAQDLAIAFAHPMERLFDRVLGHAQLGGNLRLRRAARFVGEQFLQPLEKRRFLSRASTCSSTVNAQRRS